MISDYKNRKAKGFVELEADDNKVKAKIKKFDEWTGEETEIEEELELDDLERELAIRQNQVTEIQALIDDLKKL